MAYPPFNNIQNLVKDLNDQYDRGREPHARLIVGNTGSGLLPAVIAHCAHVLTGNSADETVWGMNHPDLHFSFPIVLKQGVASSDDYMTEWRDAVRDDPFFSVKFWTGKISGDINKSAVIGKDESERIMHKLNLKSYLGGKKILVVWMAEMANTSTSNKLLKLIEEPPANTYIFLLAESIDEMLPTIISRCQLMQFAGIDHSELAAHLSEEFGIDEEKAKNLSALSEGDYFLARTLVGDNVDNTAYHDLFVSWMRMCYKKDLPEIIDWVDQVNELKRERQKSFLLYCVNFFRQCMLRAYLGDDNALLFGSERAFADKFGKFVHGGNAVQLMEKFDEEYYHLERNGNGKLVFLDLSFDVIKLLHQPVPYVAS